MSSLNTSVQAWTEPVRSVQTLCARLDPMDWARPTDCPAWDVRDVVPHVAALESELTDGGDGETTDESSGGGQSVDARHTQAGVDARRDRSPEQLLTELTEAYERRARQLRKLPEDPGTPAPRSPAGLSWDWLTLLRNRAIDVWVHEQDIRRAVGDPGGFDGAGVHVATSTFAGAMGYVLGRKVAPPADTVFVWEVSGPVELVLAYRVDDDGRARRLEDAPAQPTAGLRMDTEAFTMLATGRHSHSGVTVELAGDPRLCGQVVAQMAVTS